MAERKIRDLGAKPAFKGYYDYPCVLCTSVNNEIVHGIPSERRVLKAGRHRLHRLRRGAGRLLRRFGDHGSGRREITPELQKLLDVTRESLAQGIEAARVGNTVGDVGAAVQQVVEANGFSVVREFVGHGIGTGCTKIRRFRTTASRDMARSCAMAW